MSEVVASTGIQICFCGTDNKSLPIEPLDAHWSGCLLWDWAAANGRITPRELIAKITQTCDDLGLEITGLDDV